MSPGSNTESYPAFARIGLRESPGKNLNQITCPDRDSNPRHLVSQPDALTVTLQEHRAFVIETFFKSGDSVVKTQRAFCLQFNVSRHGAFPARNTILRWVQNFRISASACKKNHQDTFKVYERQITLSE
ncbi:hypothetical protein ANN_04781 [Periplaneta americana]|uniref:DUF4817 domain-containing protein n=1 Tax=Periplaneta americana TaxID=6978 RepID=A0ABQ8TAY2_PERAM|nr:hypothetical protein ANN_04781 [Periplaneta americana]